MLQTNLLIIHILFASLLFGGGILTSIYFINRFPHSDTKTKKQVTKTTLQLNLMLLLPAGIIQLISGFMLIVINLKNYDTHWLLLTIVSFFIAASCWLIGLFLLNTCYHQPDKKLSTYFKIWVTLTIIAFCSVTMMIYIMATHPH